MEKDTRIWDPFLLEDNKIYFWQIGPLRIWIERWNDEWIAAYDYAENETVLKYPEDGGIRYPKRPELIELNRIVAKVDKDILSFHPVMDVKPIVVGADTPFKILPKNEALIFINVPISIRITAGESKKSVLMEIPTVLLSNTWVGSPSAGELSLSLKTSAVRKIDNLNPKPNRAGCPVLIKNLSSVPLEVEKICIHTENLSIYRGNSRLWTNKMIISYLGPDKTSEIKRLKSAPGMEPDEKLLSKPVVQAKSGILRKSFDLFKQLSIS